MKTLSNYTQDKISKLLSDSGAFFAFSNKQFEESQVEGVKYASLGAGLICPKDKAKSLVEGMEKISKEGIAQDLSENGKEAIIRRELANYECFYTGCIDDCVEALEDYDISREEIQSIYNYMLANEDVGL